MRDCAAPRRWPTGRLSLRLRFDPVEESELREHRSSDSLQVDPGGDLPSVEIHERNERLVRWWGDEQRQPLLSAALELERNGRTVRCVRALHRDTARALRDCRERASEHSAAAGIGGQETWWESTQPPRRYHRDVPLPRDAQDRPRVERDPGRSELGLVPASLPAAHAGSIDPAVVKMEDVDCESVLVEPDTRVSGDPRGMLRRRQGSRLKRPPGCRHACGPREGYGDAQERPAHANDGTPGS